MSHLTNVMSEATEEIKRLRRENEILKGKVWAMELFEIALAKSQTPQAMTVREDPLWAFERLLEEMKQTEVVTDRLRGLGEGPMAKAQMAKQNIQGAVVFPDMKVVEEVVGEKSWENVPCPVP